MPSADLFCFVLTEQDVCHEHHAKANEERIRCAALVTVGVRFGDHLVADDVEHRAARKGDRDGKDGR